MLHERLTTDPSAWGLTPTQYASREKARLRDREKKRRQRADAARKQLTAPPTEPFYDIGLFETASGIIAYRKLMPNTSHIGGLLLTAKAEGMNVSLPYVSILGSVRPA